MNKLMPLATYTVQSGNQKEIKLNPVEICIYCGKKSLDSKLGDEHIIASGFGGYLILPKSSCRKCEAIINLYETRLMKEYFGLLRKKYRIQSRKAKKRRPVDRSTHPIFHGKPFERAGDWRIANEYVDKRVTELPDLMILEAFSGRPTMLTGAPRPSQFGISYVLGKEGSIPGIHFGLSITTKIGDFTRTLAKMAHGFTVALMGYNTFEPTLTSIILNGLSEEAGSKIGSFLDPPGKFCGTTLDALHVIGLNSHIVMTTSPNSGLILPKKYIVVYLKLFIGVSPVTFEIVSGIVI